MVGGGFSAPPVNRQKQDEIAAYKEAENNARDALGRLDRQREVGLGNINSVHDEQMTGIENAFNHEKGIYDLKTQEATMANRNARDRMAEESVQKSDALQKMFAMGGAGDSSAAKINAPFAVSLDASKKASILQDEYAKNRRGLDMTFANMSNVYNLNKKKLESEKQNRINSLDQNIESSRMNLNNKIREAQQKQKTASGMSLTQALNETRDLKDEIARSEDKILDLGRRVPVAIDKIAFNAPKLESYAENVRTGDIKMNNPDGDGLRDQIDPRLVNLLDPNKKKRDLEEA